MGSVLSWAANSVLFIVGCFLAADTANDVIAFLLTPPPESGIEQSAPAPVRNRTWADRQVILSRNLFNSSTLDPPPAPDEQGEDLEESELPLELLGTFASPNPLIARAALQERGNPETLVVRVGQEVANGRATVIRIERRRVVLSENGALRELTLTDANPAPVQKRPVRTARTPRRTRGRSPRAPAPNLEKLDANRFALDPEQLKNTLSNPANLLSQARIIPKFEEGQMVGLQVSAIKPGSVFEQLGVEEGDIITEINGMAIDSPNESVKVLQEFGTGQPMTMGVRGADGTPKPQITFVPSEDR